MFPLWRSRCCVEYSHQDAITKGAAGLPPLLNLAALKLTHSSAARSWSIEEIFEPLRYRNGNNLLQDRESTAGPAMDSNVTTVSLMFFFPMEMCDEGMARCETKVAPPPLPLTPTWKCVNKAFLISAGEWRNPIKERSWEVWLKKKNSVGC